MLVWAEPADIELMLKEMEKYPKLMAAQVSAGVVKQQERAKVTKLVFKCRREHAQSVFQ